MVVVCVDASVLARNNVTVSGQAAGQPIVFAHGYGCDQNMWRFVAPAFEDRYRTVLFDFVGAGGSDLSAYDPQRYGSLEGYAADVLDVVRALDLHEVIFCFGDSVSAMIEGACRQQRSLDRFAALVLVAPSPRYVDDDGYLGGFTEADIEDLLGSLDRNYLGWSSTMAPVIMGNTDRLRARRRADRQLLPDRPGGRQAFRASHLPLRQSRRPGPGEAADAGTPVLRRPDRT